MKIDRLLSIIIHLLNNNQVSASELAKRFEVSTRTIQRDMDAIELAGIPVMTTQGPHGGYSIYDSWKMDKQLMSIDDLYFIITALKGVDATLMDEKLQGTIEKMNTLMPGSAWNIFEERNEKLSIDFSQLGGDIRHKDIFAEVKRAVENEQLLEFEYTSNKLENTCRTVEPMTIAFKWKGWYLFAYCLERQDYRLFKMTRLKNTRMLPKTFKRRNLSLEQFLGRPQQQRNYQTYRLKVAPKMAAVMQEQFPPDICEPQEDGSLIVSPTFPPDNWVLGYILSFGPYVEVLSPQWVRDTIRKGAEEIAKLNS